MFFKDSDMILFSYPIVFLAQNPQPRAQWNEAVSGAVAAHHWFAQRAHEGLEHRCDVASEAAGAENGGPHS